MREAERSAVASIIRLAAERSHANRDACGGASHATHWRARARNEPAVLAVRATMRASCPLSGNGVRVT
jgi:hypothetical protein